MTVSRLYLMVPATRSLSGGPVRHAVAGPGVEAEQLSAHAVVLEAGTGAAVLAALRVQREQLAGKHPRQALLLVRRVVHAGDGLTAEQINYPLYGFFM